MGPGSVVHVVGARPNFVKMAPARVIFPVHPRTTDRLRAVGLLSSLVGAGVACREPLGYLDFLGLQIGTGAVVTDSGGMQDEASALGMPSYALRPNTERPVTISQGINTLLGEDPSPIADIRPRQLEHRVARIEARDGYAGRRAAELVAAALKSRPAGVFA